MMLQATPVRVDFHPIVAVEPSGYGAFPGAFNPVAFQTDPLPGAAGCSAGTRHRLGLAQLKWDAGRGSMRQEKRAGQDRSTMAGT